MPKNRRILLILVLALLSGLGIPQGLLSAEDKQKPAKVRVSGLGWWRDREMQIALERVLGKDRGPTLPTNSIEDAAFLLYSVLNDEGFQTPIIIIRAEGTEGKQHVYSLSETLDLTLDPGLEAKSVRFDVKTGQRSYVNQVQIEGLHVLDKKAGEGFFMTAQTLITTKASRAYSPSRVKRGAEKLREELRLRGYLQAKVEARRVNPEKKNGGPVKLHVVVDEGPLWVVSKIEFPKADPRDVGLLASGSRTGRPWTSTLQQNFTEEIRQAYYRKGYADVSIRVRAEAAPEQQGRRAVTVFAEVEPGAEIHVGNVRFEGNEHTRPAILYRRVLSKPGDPLDPVQLERARYRLSRLGVFDAVDLHFEPPDGETRDPVYVLKEGSRYEANLLAGYGSYEQLRGGVEVRQMNLFGRAHQSRLTLVQSMKSSRGEYTYTVPELFGESIDGTARVFGLQREEIAFIRQEYGGNVSLKRPVPWLRAEGTVGYTFQALKNRDNELTTRVVDDKQITVASVDVGLVRDKRDSPLMPRRGYRWFAQVEAASDKFGGEANYERIEFGATYHTAIGRWQYLHAALTHGVITTLGTTDKTVPVNKRFFKGGDTSIRGYQEGEASPRGPDGRFVGAKTYTLLNVEYEQVLTESWSAVLFGDGLGQAERLANYPFEERLYSVGLGIRYQTIVGPIRLEYGRNLNRRPSDPTGTYHLSIGFPF
ncbi:MAG: BamA/TamA family outer membrane protein [Nibricoccus sp.]